MKCHLFKNKSDRRVINKNIEIIMHGSSNNVDYIDVEFIEPVSFVHPTLILSVASKIQTADYLFLPELGRYYYIDNYTAEHNRIIVNCSVDVLMSYHEFFMQETVILDRVSKQKNLQDFYLEDDEMKLESYPWLEMHPLKCVHGDAFSQEVYYILATAGAVTGSSSNEGGEGE